MKEIEHIDPIYYSALNDFIRVGKRLISHHKLLNKIFKEYRKLESNICKEFCKHSTEHVGFRIIEERNKKTSLLISIPRTRNIDFCVQFRYCKCFDEAFSIFNSPYLIFYSKDKEEIEVIKEKVKRIIIVKYFKFKKIEEYYLKIAKLIQEEHDLQNERLFHLQRLWDSKHFPRVGETIKYSVGNRWKTGTLIKISNTNIGEVYIKTEKGSRILRYYHQIRGKDYLVYTELWKNIQQLANKLEVPECWRKNCVEFYS